MKLHILTPAILIALAAASCGRDKVNILAGLDPASKEYKQELAKQIEERGERDLTFTFNNCQSEAGKTYLNISVDGKGLHATSLVLVNNWNKLEGIQRTKGIGYSGAELKNLKVSYSDVDKQPTLVYRDLDKIID
jgi:hypothetical protein